MKSVIKTLENKIHELRIEVHIWSDERNYNAAILKNVGIEIEEHIKALELIKKSIK